MKKTLYALVPEENGFRVVATGTRRVPHPIVGRAAALLPGAAAVALLVGGLVTNIWWLLLVSLFIALLWQIGGVWEAEEAARAEAAAVDAEASEPEAEEPEEPQTEETPRGYNIAR